MDECEWTMRHETTGRTSALVRELTELARDIDDAQRPAGFPRDQPRRYQHRA
jgi:hypothetical protein